MVSFKWISKAVSLSQYQNKDSERLSCYNLRKYLYLVYISYLSLMAHIRQHKIEKITKSPRAQQFTESLLDEIRFNYEINAFWIKYRFDIVLPVNDYEKVLFKNNDNNWEFKKLKDFILHYEENWLMEW